MLKHMNFLNCISTVFDDTCLPVSYYFYNALWSTSIMSGVLLHFLFLIILPAGLPYLSRLRYPGPGGRRPLVCGGLPPPSGIVAVADWWDFQRLSASGRSPPQSGRPTGRRSLFHCGPISFIQWLYMVGTSKRALTLQMTAHSNHKTFAICETSD